MPYEVHIPLTATDVDHAARRTTASARMTFVARTPVWVFLCSDDPAMLVYAWRETSTERVVTVPGAPPVRSARDAAREYLASAA